MEEVSDSSFRTICKEYGADMMFTEFISSDALIRSAAKTLKKLDFYESERPIGIQIYGHLPEAMIEAAKIAEAAKPDLIDINFGCPMKKIAKRGAGSGMMNNVPLMVQITDAIVKTVKLPVTAKTRLGYDDENKNIIDIAERLQDVGIQALTIHGRTRSQLYKGDADWSLIGAVKNNPRMHIPIIGNGDITSAVKAKHAFDTYGVDGIMVARGSIGQPWIFRDIKHYLQTGEEHSYPKVSEIVALTKKHFQRAVELKGERGGVFEMRRHFAHYFKGLPNFRDNRIKLLRSLDVKEIYEILDWIVANYNDDMLHNSQE